MAADDLVVFGGAPGGLQVSMWAVEAVQCLWGHSHIDKDQVHLNHTTTLQWHSNTLERHRHANQSAILWGCYATWWWHSLLLSRQPASASPSSQPKHCKVNLNHHIASNTQHDMFSVMEPWGLVCWVKSQFIPGNHTVNVSAATFIHISSQGGTCPCSACLTWLLANLSQKLQQQEDYLQLQIYVIN